MTGRFSQRDPLGYAPGANLYEYAASTPSNLRDPFGRSPTNVPDISSDPDLLSHVSTSQEPPAIYMLQATLDQWLQDDWHNDESEATWLLRLRTTETGFLGLSIKKFLVDKRERTTPFWIIETRVYRIRVRITDHWQTTAVNPSQNLSRQLAIYGERLRGHRALGSGGRLLFEWNGLRTAEMRRPVMPAIFPFAADWAWLNPLGCLDALRRNLRRLYDIEKLLLGPLGGLDPAP